MITLEFNYFKIDSGKWYTCSSKFELPIKVWEISYYVAKCWDEKKFPGLMQDSVAWDVLVQVEDHAPQLYRFEHMPNLKRFS